MTGAPWMRCHETALLALILRRLVLNYLSDSNLYEEFKTLIVEYRTSHAADKRVLELMVDVMGPDWTTFIASARTLASFSVLSTIECSLNIYYRRLGDVLVVASKEQQADRMGEYHDTEFPLRIVFTAVSFKLIEELSEQILPNGIRPKAFDTKPRVCETLPEQIREVFHISKAKKINSRHKQHSIVIGSFSASIQIWIRLCWLNKIPATLYMPRLQYHQTSDDSTNLVMYKLISAPVRTHVATEKLGGSFRTINSEHEGIQDEPCWKLGGYSMYHASQPGKLLGANNDDDYIKALDQSNVGDLMFVFGFVYHEYPPQTENGGVDLLALQKSICRDMIRPLGMTLESIGLSCGLNPKHKVNNQNLLSLSVAYNGITREFSLDDTFVASQRDPAARTSYRMQCKSMPFTFNHIDISTPKIEETK
ncbi:hypothetical protein V3481_015209 [Fusarium oxysporum f. sp. vasinfectum]